MREEMLSTRRAGTGSCQRVGTGLVGFRSHGQTLPQVYPDHVGRINVIHVNKTRRDPNQGHDIILLDKELDLFHDHQGQDDPDGQRRAGSPCPDETLKVDVEHRERRHYSPGRNESHLGLGNMSPREPSRVEIGMMSSSRPQGFAGTRKMDVFYGRERQRGLKNDLEVGYGHGRRHLDAKFGQPFLKGGAVEGGCNEALPLKRLDVSVNAVGQTTRFTSPERKIRGVTGGANAGRSGVDKYGDALSPAR